MKILFLCHGNICRSPACEAIFNQLIKARHLEHKYSCSSMALTDEELGNDIYPPMKQSLDKYHIPYKHHVAKHATWLDIEDNDLIIYMDDENKWLINDQFPGCDKAVCLAKYINKDEIDDPWYHRGFDGCLELLIKAVTNLLDSLENKK